MNKLFTLFAVIAMFGLTGCKCTTEQKEVVEEDAIEAVDSVAVDVIDAIDTTLVVTE